MKMTTQLTLVAKKWVAIKLIKLIKLISGWVGITPQPDVKNVPMDPGVSVETNTAIWVAVGFTAAQMDKGKLSRDIFVSELYHSIVARVQSVNLTSVEMSELISTLVHLLRHGCIAKAANDYIPYIEETLIRAGEATEYAARYAWERVDKTADPLDEAARQSATVSYMVPRINGLYNDPDLVRRVMDLLWAGVPEHVVNAGTAKASVAIAQARAADEETVRNYLKMARNVKEAGES